MLFNIAAELLSLANACGVFKAFIDGEMWSFETPKVKGHSSQVFHSLPKCCMSKIHSHQISSFYAFPFSRSYTLKFVVFQLV